MQRSQINTIIERADEFIASYGFKLPPFADWTLDQWRQNRDRSQLILQLGLGWDITDYGQGKFAECGLVLFTIRNGKPENLKSGNGVVYAEKIMISNYQQVSPMHHHRIKTEDIINRGGGRLAIKLHEVGQNGAVDYNREVEVVCDGRLRRVPSGGIITLMPGESITLTPNIYHAFWGDDGDVLIGEVSTVNDDVNDNFFARSLGRFPAIAEDVKPTRLLVSDYNNLSSFLLAVK